MRQIGNIIIHTSATPQTASVKSIINYWKHHLKWENPGYHFIVEADGTIHRLLPLEEVSNGVRGHNSDAIHICYVGGIHPSGFPEDNRTLAQKLAIAWLIEYVQGKLEKSFREEFGNSDYIKPRVRGHNDFTNKKACPSFKVSDKTLYDGLISDRLGRTEYKWK